MACRRGSGGLVRLWVVRAGRRVGLGFAGLLLAVGVLLTVVVLPAASAARSLVTIHLSVSGPGYVAAFADGRLKCLGGPCTFTTDKGAPLAFVAAGAAPGGPAVSLAHPEDSPNMVFRWYGVSGHDCQLGAELCDTSGKNASIVVSFAKRPEIHVKVEGRGDVEDEFTARGSFATVRAGVPALEDGLLDKRIGCAASSGRCVRRWDDDLKSPDTVLGEMPAAGYRFVRWQSCDKARGYECKMILDRHAGEHDYANMTVTAVFEPDSCLSILGAHLAHATKPSPACDLTATYSGTWNETEQASYPDGSSQSYVLQFTYKETETVNPELNDQLVGTPTLAVTDGSESYTDTGDPATGCSATLSALAQQTPIYFSILGDYDGQITASPYLPGPIDMAADGTGVCSQAFTDDDDDSAAWTTAVHPTLMFPVSMRTDTVNYPVSFSGTQSEAGVTETETVSAQGTLSITES